MMQKNKGCICRSADTGVSGTGKRPAATFEKKNDSGMFLPEADFYIVEKEAALETFFIADASLEI